MAQKEGKNLRRNKNWLEGTSCLKVPWVPKPRAQKMVKALVKGTQSKEERKGSGTRAKKNPGMKKIINQGFPRTGPKRTLGIRTKNFKCQKRME